MENLVELEEMISKFPEKLQELWSLITKMANLRYHLLIYKLLRKGHVQITDLVEDTGLTKQRLYDIVDKVDKLTKAESS